jgi:hypothetical protein
LATPLDTGAEVAYTRGVTEEGISPDGHDYTTLRTGCVLVLPKGAPKHEAITILTDLLTDPFLGTYAKLAHPCIPVTVQGETLGKLVDAAMKLRLEPAFRKPEVKRVLSLVTNGEKEP